MEPELSFQPRFLNSTGDEDDTICCFWYGIIIYSLGAFCMALGVNLQKYSINKEHLKYPIDHDPRRRGLWCQPIWVLGLILYASSGGLLSFALLYATQSQLAPLMSVVIVANAFLARMLLREPIGKRDLLAIFIIIGAVILTTTFAPKSTEKYDTDELIELYKQPGFYGFVSLLVILLFSFYVCNRVFLGKIDENPPYTSALLVKCFRANIDYVPKYQEQVLAFSFGAQAGLWGGLSVTMMKSAISIIVEVSDSGGIKALLTNGLTYGLLGVLVFCWIFQLYWINAGLELYPAVFVVSIEAVLNEIIAVTGGILYFEEYTQFTLQSACLFGLGLFLGVFGIVLFATRDNYNDEDDVFKSCCAIEKIENDPNKHERPVDAISRRPSWKVEQSVSRRIPEFDEEGNIIVPDAIRHAESLQGEGKLGHVSL
mmetsp:Transcript_888/g.1082  ORF Transcript_888/g.1082 Transcript_888/m.1082 type:complete len:428 (-) Transcript_888:130-1413(-)